MQTLLQLLFFSLNCILLRSCEPPSIHWQASQRNTFENGIWYHTWFTGQGNFSDTVLTEGVEKGLTNNQAAEYCKLIGGYLAEPKTEKQQQVMADLQMGE